MKKKGLNMRQMYKKWGNEEYTETCLFLTELYNAANHEWHGMHERMM